MTTTANELAVYEDHAPALHVPLLPSLPDTDSWIRAMASIAKLAAQICRTSFVPDGMRGDDAAVTAAILTGRELGMGPMQSLRNIHVIKGVPSLRAEFKRAKVLSQGHEFRVLEWDARHCKVAARRKGDHGEPLVVEYTLAEADKAGLVKRNDNYRSDPMAMLMARVTTRVTNAIFADVTNGLATTELLDDADALADAMGAALELPAAPRPPVTDLRQRAAAQTVKAEVLASPSPAAAGTPPADVHPRTADAHPEQAAGEAPIRKETWNAITERLAGLGIEEANRVRVASRIAGKAMKDATEADGRKVRDTLDGLPDGVALDGLLAELALADDPREQDGTVPGE